METAANNGASEKVSGDELSGSMHDDIPENQREIFGPGCGCLAAILVSVVTVAIALWGVFELARAIARWWLR